MPRPKAPPQLRDRILDLRRIAARDLQDHQHNWRVHPQAQRDAMQGVLQDLGIASALLVYDSPRQGGLCVIDGHLRKSLDPTQEWPCLLLDLDDDEATYLLATHDPLGAMAEASREALAQVLETVQSGQASVQQLLAQLAEQHGVIPSTLGPGPVEDVEPEIDRAEELRQQYGVEVGQVWACGVHRVICGDCTDKAVVEQLMQGEQADLLLNDPPYGMRLDTDYSSMRNHLDFARAKGVLSGRRYAPVRGDAQAYDARPVRHLFATVTEQLWFGADYYAATLGDTMQAGSWLVWDKRLEETADRMYGSCFELIWSQQKHKRDILRHKWAGIFGTEHEPQRGRMHPTQKPVALYSDLLTRYTDEGLLVADCYLGAGTTLVACDQLQRRCYGIEIDPGYVAVTLHRWATVTGLTPTLVDG